MTALQWIVKEAKAIKKKYPKRFSKWTEYVAQASAIYASKHKGKSPVGKKKAAPKKAAKKKVGAAPKKKAAPKKVVKKVAKKAAPKKSVSLHKDTKSHNVNIRVMSGYKKIGNLDEINKGDILVSHWGYDQTNVDFYTVIKKTGLGVTLAPMGEKIVEYNSNYMSGRVLPGEINYTAKTINRKIKKYSGGVYVSINTFATASKWNGQPQYFSNYA